MKKYISLSSEMILVISVSFFLGYKLDENYKLKGFYIIILPVISIIFMIYRLIKELTTK